MIPPDWQIQGCGTKQTARKCVSAWGAVLKDTGLADVFGVYPKWSGTGVGWSVYMGVHSGVTPEQFDAAISRVRRLLERYNDPQSSHPGRRGGDPEGTWPTTRM